jgi:hypothetical protein
MMGHIFAAQGGGIYTNFPEAVDWYLWNECDIDEVVEQLLRQYPDGGQPVNEFGQGLDKIKLLFGKDGFHKSIEFVRFVEEFSHELVQSMWLNEDGYFSVEE